MGKNWPGRIANRTDLQGELFPGQSVVELFADDRVLIERHFLGGVYEKYIDHGKTSVCYLFHPISYHKSRDSSMH